MTAGNQTRRTRWSFKRTPEYTRKLQCV